MNKRKFGMIYRSILLLLIALPLQLLATFSDQWREMQLLYNDVTQKCAKKQYNEEPFAQPYWANVKQLIRISILGPANERFLFGQEILHNMVRSDSSYMNEYEIAYLTHLTSETTRKRLEHFSETRFGALPITVDEFRCTPNSLGQLYYAARIFEAVGDSPLKTIIEFGGGFGNLARIFKLMDPAATYVIIDFPELLALQYLYLKNSLDNVPIIMHSEETVHDLAPGSIHLIPVYFIESTELKADVFISCFGISEAPRVIQNMVIQKRFFDASWCYLSGQMKPEWNHVDLVPHDILLGNIRKNYLHVASQPFHVPPDDFKKLLSYEVEASGLLQRKD